VRGEVENLDEKLKYEIITELGLFEKVSKNGWKSLTAKETGRIGGLITKRKKMMQMQKSQQA
jgi:small acid-soluble spore protein F (minor alpha/beta-type SASP)